MAQPTETYIDPAVAGGNDFGGTSFTDGSFANATNTLTKTGAFPAATNIAGDRIYLTDNGSGEVTTGLYKILTRTDDDNIILDADIRSGGNDPTDVVCTLHDGTISLPWVSTQHGLNFTTQGSAGDRFNIKEGTDDDLSAGYNTALSITIYGTPLIAKPLIFQGYTSAAGDGGQGGISGGGSLGIYASLGQGILFINLHLHNCGSANIIDIAGSKSGVFGCELNNTSGSAILSTFNSIASYNNIHDIGGLGINLTSGGCIGNYLKNGTKSFTQAIELNGAIPYAIGNIISIGGTSNGIRLGSDVSLVMGNSILSSGGAGTGIRNLSGSMSGIINNLIEGFSDAGGIGIDYASINESHYVIGNAAYNNLIDYENTGGQLIDYPASPDNEELSATSLFAREGSDIFDNRFKYFAPVDTGNVHGGAL